jgi:hypothetical protein
MKIIPKSTQLFIQSCPQKAYSKEKQVFGSWQVWRLLFGALSVTVVGFLLGFD